jgi:lysophospholipase L1-like esterase
VFLALLVLEGACRLLGVRGHYRHTVRIWNNARIGRLSDTLPGVFLQYRPFSEFAVVYDSNPRGYFDENNSIVYKMNRHGFRGPDWDMQKPPGTRRVLLLGDSFTLGEGVRYEHTYGVALQALLRERLGDRRVEVVACAVTGWATKDEINFYRYFAHKFEPDVVIVSYVLNDIASSAEVDFWNEFREQYENRALRHSYLASFVWARIAYRTHARRYVEDMVADAIANEDLGNESCEYLSLGKQISEMIGARYAVAVFPFMFRLDERYPFKPVHDRVVQYCRTNGIEVVDLFEAYEGHNARDLWVHPSDQHPNENGHLIAARALATFIESSNLLGQRSEVGTRPTQSSPQRK